MSYRDDPSMKSEVVRPHPGEGYNEQVRYEKEVFKKLTVFLEHRYKAGYYNPASPIDIRSPCLYHPHEHSTELGNTSTEKQER